MHVTKPKLSWLEDPTVFAVNRLVPLIPTTNSTVLKQVKIH